jgi:hypothetical protein
MILSKTAINEALKTHIEDRIAFAVHSHAEATESVHAETKGSAGDKHETGRAMAQLEVEKAGKVLKEAQQMKQVLGLLEPEKTRAACTVGALVESTQGLFYLSMGLGKINVNGTDVFCVGMNSPVGQALFNKKAGAHYQVGSIKAEILSIG